MNDATLGAQRLLNTLNGKSPAPSAGLDPDAEIHDDLPVLEYADVSDLGLDFTNAQRLRSRVRYLAALWPDANLQDLTHRVHGLLNNKHFTVEDLRIILAGRRLTDPTKHTNEVPLTVIQGIGKCLRDGMSLRATARENRVAYDTVEAIEKFLGIRQSRENKIVDAAVDAARDGVSVRSFAKRYDVSRSKAHRLLAKGQSVLKELGE